MMIEVGVTNAFGFGPFELSAIVLTTSREVSEAVGNYG
jgi:hypothetical protein